MMSDAEEKTKKKDDPKEEEEKEVDDNEGEDATGDNNNNENHGHERKGARRLRTQSARFDAPLVGQVSFGSSWERRLQTLALFSCSLYFIMPMVPVSWYWTIRFILNPTTRIPMLIYLGYTFVLNDSPRSGEYWLGPWIRKLDRWWRSACDYFPIVLVKTADLPPDTSYVMGYHPHGIISVGAMGGFSTNGARTIDLSKADVKEPADDPDALANQPRGFSSLFPGIERNVVTLPVNFATPFVRDYLLSFGCVTSDKQTFRKTLARNNGVGNALVVVVGGAAESMLVEPGSIQLVLEKRRGFVREAIRAGASLVPTLAFGETDLYYVLDETNEGSWVKRFQTFVKKSTGVAMPLFQGRSFLFQDFGLMPLRKPIVIVVGAPIAPPKLKEGEVFDPIVDRNTKQAQNEHGKLLIEWHEKYVKALKELYATHKDKEWNKPGRSRRASMEVVQ